MSLNYVASVTIRKHEAVRIAVCPSHIDGLLEIVKWTFNLSQISEKFKTESLKRLQAYIDDKDRRYETFDIELCSDSQIISIQISKIDYVGMGELLNSISRMDGAYVMINASKLI